jgi:hypothetical protein
MADNTLQARLADARGYRFKGSENIQIYHPEREDGVLEIKFHRTVRVPDNRRKYALPPDLGCIPIYSVPDYQDSMPEDMVAKGGVFIPMYRECPLSIDLFLAAVFGHRVEILMLK